MSAMMYQYHFTSTIEDLLEAERSDSPTKSMTPVLRWTLVLFGCALLILGAVNFRGQSQDWQYLVWIAIGLTALYLLVVKPHLRRRRITRSNPKEVDVSLEFNEEHILINIGNVGSFLRQWNELSKFQEANKGILFYFTDGGVNWLPKRAFANMIEAHKFIDFLQAKLNVTPNGPKHKTTLGI